jgi:hypothetical protein
MNHKLQNKEHSKWIIGYGNDSREYLIHTELPKFRCLIIPANKSFDFSKETGTIIRSAGFYLVGFIWEDLKPDNCDSLLEQACDAVDEITDTNLTTW